jgi:hypothetical protein
MSVETDIQDILEAAAAVTALCPASRIRVPGDWQNLTRPYVIHFPVGTAPQRTHAGLQVLCLWDPYQISVFADTYSAGRALADVIRIALDGAHASGVNAQWERMFPAPSDPDTTISHIISEFRVAVPLV